MATTGISPVMVGHVPGRKNPVLLTVPEGKVLATFKSEETMREFMAMRPRVDEQRIGGGE